MTSERGIQSVTNLTVRQWNEGDILRLLSNPISDNDRLESSRFSVVRIVLLYVLSRLTDRRYCRCLLLFRVFYEPPRCIDTRYVVEASRWWLLVLRMWLSTILSEARLHHVPLDFKNSLN